MKILKIVGVVVILFLLILFIIKCNISIKERIIKNNYLLDLNIIDVNVEDMIEEFIFNKEYAIEKYNDKKIRITGIIASRGFPKDWIPRKDASYIVFGNIFDENGFYDYKKTAIICYFDKIEVHEVIINENIIQLEDGYKIILEGIYSEYNEQTNDIILRHSKIVDVLGNT